MMMMMKIELPTATIDAMMELNAFGTLVGRNRPLQHKAYHSHFECSAAAALRAN